MGITVASSLPAGTVADFAGSTTPNGWLFCYGQAVSRSLYSALFTAIGTAFGAGDGSTTFNLPDARGRALFGKDDMGGSAANRLTSGGSGVAGTTIGGVGGSETVTLTTNDLPSHYHMTDGTLSGNQHIANSGSDNQFDYRSSYANANDGGYITGSKTGALGGGGAHKVVNPCLVMNKIIKV